VHQRFASVTTGIVARNVDTHGGAADS